METNKVLEKIIECGKTENFTQLKLLFPNWQTYQHFLQKIKEKIKSENGGQFIHYYEIFAQLGERYNFDELTYLIKGLTIAENEAKMGSVSPVIELYKKLVEKAGLLYFLSGDKLGVHLLAQNLADNPNKEVEELTHWVLKHSDNIYLPFGISTLNAKTFREIKLETEGWKQRQKKIAVQEENLKREKEERDAKRQVEVENNIKEHQDKTEKQRKFREQLNSFTLSELLKTINADKQRPIYFYASELNKIEKTSLTTEQKNLIRELIKKFKQVENGQFKRLKAMLISYVD